MTPTTRPRRPRAVYESGNEPDPRFSLANERTLLAWLRTALALVVSGLGAVALSDLVSPTWLLGATAAIAFGSGAAACLLGYRQWQRAEWALRHDEALPSGSRAVVIVGAILMMAVIGVFALLTMTGAVA